ncbi:protein of unknown function [Taphrina deformans PYCC 5710]|uniref:mRNA export factor GLE1 n=1 Tax=Taphrina deformans (strain PYCC 5710 / ATCC 11124 / CBS 356.35 / IMI 108563 / JCM 9778 / NBRC 8474) TaxID=1097556 RepID=R4XJE0_TAPDE|nr:protein of unknown function [Taphrina deformans PYCC 5710]|eukprot:CCG84581.1 protein of unknown function [Taphrina deformans PYCC 5710]
MIFSPDGPTSLEKDEWELIEREDDENIEDEDDYVYDTDDSEDFEYPVHRSSATWEYYNKSTEYAINEAVASRSEQVRKLESLLQHGVTTRYQAQLKQTADDLEDLTNLLQAAELEQKLEDDLRNEQFQTSNDILLQGVQRTIAKAEADEEKRVAELAAAQAKAQKIASERKAAEAKAEEERIKVEAAKSQRIEAEEKAASERSAAAKEAERVKAKAVVDAEEAQRKQKDVLGTSPAEDAANWKARLEQFKVDVLSPVSESKDLKNFCHRARLKINPRIGQVTKSIEQIGQVSTGLKAIFDEASTKDPHRLALRWCLNFFCKAIVRQAEGEVMVKPSAAYPLAFLTISLMSQYPELLDLYLCRIAKKCPWTIPFVAYSKDTESGRKSLGYKRNSEGKYESSTTYLERQSGIFILWAATCSLELKSSPYNISNGWKFLARLVNSSITDEELRNVAFAMVSSFMEIAGKSLVQRYGNQGRKLLQVTALWVGPDMKGANASRLRILLEEYLTTGKIGLDYEFER